MARCYKCTRFASYYVLPKGKKSIYGYFACTKHASKEEENDEGNEDYEED